MIFNFLDNGPENKPNFILVVRSFEPAYEEITTMDEAFCKFNKNSTATTIFKHNFTRGNVYNNYFYEPNNENFYLFDNDHAATINKNGILKEIKMNKTLFKSRIRGFAYDSKNNNLYLLFLDGKNIGMTSLNKFDEGQVQRYFNVTSDEDPDSDYIEYLALYPEKGFIFFATSNFFIFYLFILIVCFSLFNW